jgi:hypothetical protein
MFSPGVSTPAPSQTNAPFDMSSLMGGGMNLGAMQQQLMQNPDMMQQMMNSPMMQNMLNNPELLTNMMTSNPQMQAMLDANPHIRHVLNNPAVRIYILFLNIFYHMKIRLCVKLWNSCVILMRCKK